MKKAIISGVAALSLAVAVPIFAAEESQSSGDTTAQFERMKADHLRKIDERISSLQAERACAQAAKDPSELRTCRIKHKSEMRARSDEMRRRGGPGGPGGPTPPQSQ